jgi:hypothetical protein
MTAQFRLKKPAIGLARFPSSRLESIVVGLALFVF